MISLKQIMSIFVLAHRSHHHLTHHHPPAPLPQSEPRMTKHSPGKYQPSPFTECLTQFSLHIYRHLLLTAGLPQGIEIGSMEGGWLAGSSKYLAVPVN